MVMLRCSRLTLYRYLVQATEHGIESLVDKRGGNNHKLTPKQESDLVTIKQQGRW